MATLTNIADGPLWIISTYLAPEDSIESRSEPLPESDSAVFNQSQEKLKEATTLVPLLGIARFRVLSKSSCESGRGAVKIRGGSY